MASSSSPSLSQNVPPGYSGLSKSRNSIGFLSPNFVSNYSNGKLKLLQSFCGLYGASFPRTVYLYLPSGAIWYGAYVHEKSTIEGLENFMRYYDIKPYDLVLYEYLGGPNFGVEIFNGYAVAIDYGLKDIPFEYGICKKNHVGCDVDTVRNINDIEIEKLCSTLSYNAHSTLSAPCDLLISDKHLEKAPYTKVLTLEECSALGLNSSIKWIELGFKKTFWHIKLKWDNGSPFFEKGWARFIDDNKISVGDICVFLTTSNSQRFKIAIFDKQSCGIFNQAAGFDKVKRDLKFYKVINCETLVKGQLEIPRVFLNCLGDMLADYLRLILADGCEFFPTFCCRSKVMMGFKKMLDHYSVNKDYFLFFNYVGKSTFYVSIYNEMGMDIFNKKDRKLLLHELVQKLEKEVMVVCDSSSEDSHDLAAMEVDTSQADVLSNVRRVQLSDQVLKHFTCVLNLSHVDQSGHGVYFERHLLPIYGTWKNSTIVKLICNGRTWMVAVHRKKKICRFGRGWDKFTKDNTLKKGQKLKFSFLHDYNFAVTVVTGTQ